MIEYDIYHEIKIKTLSKPENWQGMKISQKNSLTSSCNKCPTQNIWHRPSKQHSAPTSRAGRQAAQTANNPTQVKIHFPSFSRPVCRAPGIGARTVCVRRHHNAFSLLWRASAGTFRASSPGSILAASVERQRERSSSSKSAFNYRRSRVRDSRNGDGTWKIAQPEV